MREVRVAGLAPTGLAMRVEIGPHVLRGDEPLDVGGTDTGPEPNELLLAALGTCTAMTIRLYAARKGWRLTDTQVRLSARTIDGVFHISESITLEGNLDEEQRARLLEIAARCPVHRKLTGEVRIDTAAGVTR